MAAIPSEVFNTEQEGTIELTVGDTSFVVSVRTVHNAFGQGTPTRCSPLSASNSTKLLSCDPTRLAKSAGYPSDTQQIRAREWIAGNR